MSFFVKELPNNCCKNGPNQFYKNTRPYIMQNWQSGWMKKVLIHLWWKRQIPVDSVFLLFFLRNVLTSPPEKRGWDVISRPQAEVYFGNLPSSFWKAPSIFFLFPFFVCYFVDYYYFYLFYFLFTNVCWTFFVCMLKF